MFPLKWLWALVFITAAPRVPRVMATAKVQIIYLLRTSDILQRTEVVSSVNDIRSLQVDEQDGIKTNI